MDWTLVDTFRSFNSIWTEETSLSTLDYLEISAGCSSEAGALSSPEQ